MAHLRNFLHHYQQFKNKIFTYVLYRVFFDRDMAEDLTSEIFLKAYEHFEAFDEKRPFSPWIYTIAHNHLMTFLKNRKQLLSLDEARTASEDPAFINRIEEKMLTGKILHFMKKLPDIQQTVLLLRFQHGLSHAEIGAITAQEEPTVRVTLSRAIASLRQKFIEGSNS